jgi:Ulp1 family protease
MTAACSDTEHRSENCNITSQFEPADCGTEVTFEAVNRNSSIDKNDDATNAVAGEHPPTPENVNNVANDVGHLRNLTALDHATADAKRRSWDALSIFAIGNCSILGTDIVTLDNSNWLNDAVMHAYLALLMSEQRNSTDKLYVLPAFLAAKWESGRFGDWLYAKAQLNRYSWILMPVNVGNSHWVLIVGDVRRGRLGFIDSMESEAYSIYVKYWKAYVAVRSSKVGELGDWRAVTYNCSQQTDSYSCGILCLMDAEAVIRHIDLSEVKPSLATYYRRYVTTRLVTARPGRRAFSCGGGAPGDFCRRQRRAD